MAADIKNLYQRLLKWTKKAESEMKMTLTELGKVKTGKLYRSVKLEIVKNSNGSYTVSTKNFVDYAGYIDKSTHFMDPLRKFNNTFAKEGASVMIELAKDIIKDEKKKHKNIK
jgi:hypothetical protein